MFCMKYTLFQVEGEILKIVINLKNIKPEKYSQNDCYYIS